jgi:hypothetical protein
MNFKQWIIDLFKDERGLTSIKPVIALIGAISLCLTMEASAIWPNFKPNDDIIYAVVAITIASIGGDVADKFSHKPGSTPPNDETK